MRSPHAAVAALTSVVLLGSGCPGPGPDPDPEGQVNLVVSMHSSTATTLANPIHLAVGWYPTWLGTPSGPNSIIVSQDVEISGAVPTGLVFGFQGTPPEAALVDLAETGGEGRAAYGVLMAYEDRNGNGQFDLATATRPSPDRIVGISDADPSLPPPLHHSFVAYIDGTQGPDSYLRAFHLAKGYTLMEAHSDYGVRSVAPEELSMAGGLPRTGVNIEVTDTDALQIYGCADLDFRLGFRTACGIDPFGGKYRIYGALSEWKAASFEIDDGNGLRSDATVLLNGTALTYDQPTTRYVGDRPRAGANALQFDVPGHPSETITVEVPAPVNLTTQIPVQAQSGTALTVAWSDDPAVELYDVNVRDQDARIIFFHDNLNANTFTTAPINHAGWVWVSVQGLAPLAVGPNGGYVTGVSRAGGWVNFVP